MSGAESGTASLALGAAELAAVRARLAGRVHRTPVFHSRILSRIAGGELFLKGEHLQRGGAFKIRGALNFLLGLTPAEAKRGVVTASSGNHGQAVALAARDLGIQAVVVVPEDIAEVKRAAIEDYGARVEVAGLSSADRLARARELAAEGAVFVPPYDHPRIIEGQATAGAELAEDVPELDLVAVPVGGGGLISGVALAFRALQPKVKIIGVETEAANDAQRSFRSGARVAISLPDTIADGIRNLEVGQLNWDVIRTTVDDMVTVSEREVVEAMGLLLTRAKIVAEPTGAVAPAAVLSGKVKGARVAAIVSGGNVDPPLLGRLLGESGS
ncbi:MAG TPA: threonine/serine dehydratase [Candidatus Udaeobacter sp.]|nr:threonine/serine dehydratase [Candidatus Udaeobacter sp.]